MCLKGQGEPNNTKLVVSDIHHKKIFCYLSSFLKRCYSYKCCVLTGSLYELKRFIDPSQSMLQTIQNLQLNFRRDNVEQNPPPPGIIYVELFYSWKYVLQHGKCSHDNNRYWSSQRMTYADDTQKHDAIVRLDPRPS